MTTILNKEKILEQARIYVDEGKFDKAISEYEKILVADPEDLRVKLRIAELYTKRKQINDAIRIYREVANSYTNEGFYLKAVTVLKNILRLNPTLIDVNQMLANLYEKMGLIQDAMRQYTILATTFEQKGEAGKSLEIRKKIVELDPASETARIKLAEVLEREGEEEEAVNQYEEIVKLYEAQGKRNLRLAEMYEKVLAHRENVDMLKELCRIYYELGENKRVLKWTEQQKQVTLGDPELLMMQAKVYASLNQIETARSKYMALADLERGEDRIEEALNAYVEILLLVPDDEERIYRRVEDLGEEKVEELKTIVEIRRRHIKETEKRKEEELKEEEETQRREERQLKKEKSKTIKDKKELKKEPLKQEKTPKIVQKQEPLKIEKSSIESAGSKKNVNEGEAEATFNLANAYFKMGLFSEARVEFEKAACIYQDIIDSDGEGKDRARQKLDEIHIILKKKTSGEPKAERTILPRFSKDDGKKDGEKIEGSPKETEKEEPVKKEDTSRKKISFV